MPADNRTRITDTLDYLAHHRLDPGGTTAGLAKARDADQLGPLLSIGGFRGPSMFQSDAKTQQRRALRGLLLTYLTRGDLPAVEVPRLKADFLERPIDLLDSQIRWMLTHSPTRDSVTSDAQARANAARIAMRATTAPAFPVDNGCDFAAWRFDPASDLPPKGLNCYGAALFWLFRGGAFSHRWLLPLLQPSSQNAIDTAVTHGTAPSALPQLLHATGADEGRLVLLYRAGRPLAHVMVADGTGSFASNNTPYAQCPPALAHDLATCQGVFAGIDQAALGGFRPIRITFAQVQTALPIAPAGPYAGYAILDAAHAPWEGRAVWNR